jgi:hypothetical protein
MIARIRFWRSLGSKPRYRRERLASRVASSACQLIQVNLLFRLHDPIGGGRFEKRRISFVNIPGVIRHSECGMTASTDAAQAGIGRPRH